MPSTELGFSTAVGGGVADGVTAAVTPCISFASVAWGTTPLTGERAQAIGRLLFQALLTFHRLVESYHLVVIWL